MLANIRLAVLALVILPIACTGSVAWGDHGHGGGGAHGHGGGSSHSGGHGFSGGHSSFSGGHGGFSRGHSGFSGGHGHVSHSNFAGHNGSSNHWNGGNGHYYAGHSGYHNHGWPYNYSYYRNNYYRPYGYGYGYPFLYGLLGLNNYGYPGNYYGYSNYDYSYPSYDYSYPSDYYVNDDDGYYASAPPREYVASRPVYDVAQVQFRLPDPQATIWVQGQEINSSGTVRQFRSPQLDPSQEYTYKVKAQWNNNGKLVTDERQVKVKANSLAVVDFTQPNQSGVGGLPMPDLPPPQPRPNE